MPQRSIHPRYHPRRPPSSSRRRLARELITSSTAVEPTIVGLVGEDVFGDFARVVQEDGVLVLGRESILNRDPHRLRRTTRSDIERYSAQSDEAVLGHHVDNRLMSLATANGPSYTGDLREKPYESPVLLVPPP